jgi:hypothetical protein
VAPEDPIEGASARADAAASLARELAGTASSGSSAPRRQGDSVSVHLVLGEPVLVREHVERLVSGVLGDARPPLTYAVFGADDGAPGAIELAMTVPMLGKMRVVCIPGNRVGERAAAPRSRGVRGGAGDEHAPRDLGRRRSRRQRGARSGQEARSRREEERRGLAAEVRRTSIRCAS